MPADNDDRHSDAQRPDDREAPATSAQAGPDGLMSKVWRQMDRAADEVFDGASSLVSGTVKGAEHLAGGAIKGVGRVVDGAVEGADYVIDKSVQGGVWAGRQVAGLGKNVLKGPVATLRYFVSPKFRREVGNPYIRALLVENFARLRSEALNSQEMTAILWRYGTGDKLTSSEKKRAKKQLLEVVKVVPALGLFALPGGGLLLPILAKLLPFHLLPVSFYRSKAELEQIEQDLAHRRQAERQAIAEGRDLDDETPPHPEALPSAPPTVLAPPPDASASPEVSPPLSDPPASPPPSSDQGSPR